MHPTDLDTLMARARKSTKSAPQTEPQVAPQTPPAPVGERYVCVHGHFYQPPRENPWLETVEVQSSAAPYHDWNERITEECYAPNGASRILNTVGKIVRITNNYAHMSFNFGPTLLSWLKDFSPRTYRMILDADLASRDRFSGHGSAMAQVYNHIIMPLANKRDALTQIRWGITDFESRFNRRPEGIWLAETAANTEVLDLLAQEGIRFTVLAPSQAWRVRPIASATDETSTDETSTKDANEAEWTEVYDAIDTTRPYRVNLPEGRSIAVFFYNGPISRAIAFEGLLNSGEDFSRRLTEAFHPPEEGADGKPLPQLVHIATDGESYGHHHRHGDMALAYALHNLEERGLARLTNYGEYLAKFPPQFEAQIAENSSWSCAHGVERWRADCGCNGGHGGWNQQWRSPLREALDELRDGVAPLTEQLGSQFFHDVWRARDGYIRVIINRSPESETAFLAEHARHWLTEEERIRVWELMELQRHTQLMYTSCGWFFDDISGIETVQVIAYAGRVLELAKKLFGDTAKPLEAKFLATLANAGSNLSDPSSGEEVFNRWVRPMFIGLEQVAAHYAISSVFRPYSEEGVLFCFDIRRISEDIFSSGRSRLAIGRVRVRSRITEQHEEIAFVVLHLGDQNLSAAVCCSADIPHEDFQQFIHHARDAMSRAALPEVIRSVDTLFGGMKYSLSSLFHDEQQRILRAILDTTVTEVEESLRRIYQDHSSLLNYLSGANMPAPPALNLAAEFALNASLRQSLEKKPFDAVNVRSLLERAELEHIHLNEQQLAFSAEECMRRVMHHLEEEGAGDRPNTTLAIAIDIAETIHHLPFEVDLWQAQNIWYDLLRLQGPLWSTEWRQQWMRLGQALDIETRQLVIEPGVSIALTQEPQAIAS